jgi:FG-GAP repeat/FG-GAP-like repeat
MRRAVAAGSALVLISGVVAVVSPVSAGVAEAAGGTARPCDFDGDGFEDLAVGVPWEDVRGRSDAGAVQVLYGSASGVTARDQLWHQGRTGVKGALERGDRFGDALACGDFDDDGYADLAIGAPWEDVGRIPDAGIVQVLYGSARGLTARDQVWHQGRPGVPGSNEREDLFGSSLAVGDFDADGYADLVVGSPYEAVGSLDQAGRAVVLRGGPRGLTASGALSLRQGLAGIAGQPGQGERFGYRMAAGDVTGDGFDDIAIVAHAESDLPADAEGPGSALHLILGSPSGLTSIGSQYVLSTELFGEDSQARFWPTFGDFDRDGRADLVLSSADGYVAVLHGNPGGVDAAALPLTETTTPGQDGWWRAGSGEEGYGINAAAGDLTGDGYSDIVVERGSTVVGVILGTSAGLAPGSRTWAIPTSEYTDLQALSLSGGAHMWLVTSNSSSSGPEGAGAVTVLRGNPDGSAGPVTVWSQDSPGIKGAAEAGDGFGTVIGGCCGAMSH